MDVPTLTPMMMGTEARTVSTVGALRQPATPTPPPSREGRGTHALSLNLFSELPDLREPDAVQDWAVFPPGSQQS